MNPLRLLASRLRGLFGSRRLDRQLDDEVQFHLDMLTDSFQQAGMAPREARLAARRSFGSVGGMKESYRERRGFAFFPALTQDVRFAFRTLRRSPAYTAAAVGVLALAIGCTTAMVTVARAALLRPLPFPQPEELALVWSEIPKEGLREGRTGYARVAEWRRLNRSFTGLAVFDPLPAILTSRDGRMERINVVRASPNFFALLGVRPALGRLFTEREAEERQRLAVVSHSFWQNRMGGTAEAIGTVLTLDRVTVHVIGVLPKEFQFPRDATDVWEPHTVFPDWEAQRRSRGRGSWFVLGRMNAGVTTEQAQAEMAAIAGRMEDGELGASVTGLREQLLGSRGRMAVWLLLGAVAAVLGIGCANVAGLTLARGTARTKEMATRRALGASAVRLVQQLLVESTTLAVLAGVAGVAVAWAGLALARAFPGAAAIGLAELELDGWSLGGGAAACLGTGVLSGLLGLAGKATRQGPLRRGLVAGELALTILLLAGAGLLARSLWAAESVERGFRTEGLVAGQLAGPEGRRMAFLDALLGRLQGMPGVEGAAIVSNLFARRGAEAAVRTESGVVRMRVRSDEVSDGFFQVMGTALREGRWFRGADGTGSEAVAIVNETMARRLWPGAAAVGRRFQVGEGAWFTVIGVAGDMRRQGLENETAPQMFEPLRQNPPRLAAVVLRTTLGANGTAEALRLAVRETDASVPVYGVSAVEEQLRLELGPRRFQTTLVWVFAGMALTIAAVGVYGLMQYSVAMQTREIGIRMALGARSATIFAMVLREGAVLIGAGMLTGLAGVLALGPLSRGLLFGVGAADPLALGAACVLLALIGFGAGYFPARRAMRMDPAAALRQT